MVDYYKALDLSSTASAEEIKKSIDVKMRAQINRCNHPQTEKRQEAERMVKILEEAENTLLDSAKRAEYDKKLRSTPVDEHKMDESDLKNKDDLIKEGRRLLIDGNIPDALYVATKATEKNGDNPEAWALLAQAKFRWGMVDDSIYEYKRAIKLRPNAPDYYFDLGCVYESESRWKDAVDNYERASQCDPKTPMYRAAIGNVFVRLQMYKEAMPILEQCLQEDPTNGPFNYLLAVAYNDYSISQLTDGGYCTTSEHASTMQTYTEKALALKFDDNELRSLLQKNLEVAIWSNSKHWSRGIFGIIKGVIAAIVFLMIASEVKSGGFFIVGIISIGLWVMFGFKYGYDINRENHR